MSVWIHGVRRSHMRELSFADLEVRRDEERSLGRFLVSQ
jgi:hypothetical protein